MVGEVQCPNRRRRGRKYLHMFQTRCFLISSTVQVCAKQAPMFSATNALLNTCDVRNMILKKVWALGRLITLRAHSSHACTKGPAQYPFIVSISQWPPLHYQFPTHPYRKTCNAPTRVSPWLSRRPKKSRARTTYKSGAKTTN